MAPIAISLLIDDSGSMSSSIPGQFVTKEDAAYDASVVLIEAFRCLPQVSLEVLKHSSCGDLNEECLVIECFEDTNQEAFRIAESLGQCNYDHVAIETSANRLLQRQGPATRRILLVLSDGAPSGLDYDGPPAVQATREVVDAFRHDHHLQIIGVAIDDAAAEEIYGMDWTIKFHDMSLLVQSLSNLFIRILGE